MNIIRAAHSRALCLLFILIGWCTGLHGQTILGDEQITVDLFCSFIGAGFSFQPSRNFRDVSGSYSLLSTGAEVTLPLYEAGSNEVNEKELTLVLVHGNASAIRPDISILSHQHTLYTGSMGVTYGTFTSGRMDYTVTIRAGVAEDDNTIHDPHGRISGFALGTSLMNENIFFIYGLAYTYTFDRGRVFPVLGLRWRFADDWTLQVMLPFTAHVRYRYTRNLSFGFGFDVHGNRYRFSDEQLSGGQSEVLSLRLTELQSAATVNWKLNKDLLLNFETGIATARNMYISSANSDLFSSGIKPAAFIGMKIHFMLGENGLPFENDSLE